ILLKTIRERLRRRSLVGSVLNLSNSRITVIGTTRHTSLTPNILAQEISSTGFEIKYKLTADNVPDVVEGKLTIRVHRI
ncbi:MAG TPA: hypothetical protein VHO69_11315, partial [Phototrophicaceae bacterium]|nr:hypothetical protein [Phototrophicaceae bacterium]